MSVHDVEVTYFFKNLNPPHPPLLLSSKARQSRKRRIASLALVSPAELLVDRKQQLEGCLGKLTLRKDLPSFNLTVNQSELDAQQARKVALVKELQEVEQKKNKAFSSVAACSEEILKIKAEPKKYRAVLNECRMS